MNKTTTIMKKKLYTALLMLAATTAAVHAENYFTLGENDTLRVPSSCLGKQFTAAVHAHFDGYLDNWLVTVGFGDSGVSVAGAEAGADMAVPYTKVDGSTDVYYAPLSMNSDKTSFSSTITVFGYWENGGYYDRYGTVKWSDGYHADMMRLTLSIPADFDGCTMTLNGTLSSTGDWRGVGTVSYGTFQREVCVVLTMVRGDVDGDGSVTISDVTALIGHLLSGTIPTAEAGADVDGDGSVTISDVTALINLLLKS